MWSQCPDVVKKNHKKKTAKRDVWSKSADMVLPLLAPVAPQGRAALLDGVGQVKTSNLLTNLISQLLLLTNLLALLDGLGQVNNLIC